MRLSIAFLYRLLILAVTFGVSAQPVTAVPSFAESGGITSPAAGDAVQGVVVVSGVAQGTDFAKWQLDLLPGGDASQAVFLAVGETAAPVAGRLTQFDSARFPDGAHTLRLRVVRRDGNYDEYTAAITIANTSPAPGLRPAPSNSARLVNARAATLGLPARTADGQPILYLTFDDGPSPTLTPQVVALLKRYNAQATFFVIGVHVRRAPAALHRVAEAGHTIANHTLSHKTLVGRSWEAFAEELRATEELVNAALGDLRQIVQRIRYLRPPGGRVDDRTGSYAAELGYQVVAWDIDPKDWRRPGAAAISSHVIQRAFPGAIVVLHDGGGASQQTVLALETILEELSRLGYAFRALGSPDLPPGNAEADQQSAPGASLYRGQEVWGINPIR